jgi:outer membrane immunogenic protein
MKHAMFAALAASAAAISATPALAQTYDWSGFYIGGNLGVAWGDTELNTRATAGDGSTFIPPADADLLNAPINDDDNDSGFAGGIEGGYNYQSGNWVFGLESDIGFFDLGQSRSKTFTSAITATPPIQATFSQEVSTDWIWTIRPRVGYASGPWMVYATGGLAVSSVTLDTRYTDNRPTPITASDSEDDTKTGWTLGLGGAYALTPNWSVRGDWLYVDLGTVNAVAGATDNYATFTSEAQVHGNILRVGVDYKF